MNKQERKVKSLVERNRIRKETIKSSVRNEVGDLIHIVNTSAISYDECTKLKYELTRLINIEMKGGPVL
ncbi:hypothetical protein [Dellaglioa algida]|uniref:hypothetical protein n=1 Tax=Dellaglioa algida TaxID=105612 RepID=UPI0024C496C6|nr:hypothetical protein [Dellaglioa algida]MDK1716390.1 hypothetical protein [Dellaglioa algida]MDK1720256.1 hypothetical protein [Dellaglioa algida]MDK1721331.1 hypothetical protein [Dellaglioa algida]